MSKAFANTVLRKVFGPMRKRQQKTRKLHIEKLHDFYWSANIVWVAKSRGKRCVGQVARLRDRRGGEI